jgi:hypothetical protein
MRVRPRSVLALALRLIKRKHCNNIVGQVVVMMSSFQLQHESALNLEKEVKDNRPPKRDPT